MEGANSSTCWTLGCAENLFMHIGHIDFQLHAHVIEKAPFKLLLGQTFHNLLLSCLEDKPDDGVDLAIRDPADPSSSFSFLT